MFSGLLIQKYEIYKFGVGIGNKIAINKILLCQLKTLLIFVNICFQTVAELAYVFMQYQAQ